MDNLIVTIIVAFIAYRVGLSIADKDAEEHRKALGLPPVKRDLIGRIDKDVKNGQANHA